MFLFERKDGYDLNKVIDCGQCFRFENNGENAYIGVAYGKIINASQDEKNIYIDGFDSKNEAEEYFGLNVDYGPMKKDILSRFSDTPAMKRAIEVSNGLAIMKQEKWETLISFIISQNNNIPRIKKLIKSISQTCGKELGNGLYSFPTAEEILKIGEKGLYDLHFGYRAPYIYKTALDVSQGKIDLDSFDVLETKDLIKKLTSIYGVGPKVANCIALFAYNRLDAFPVDVWIKRALEEDFCGHTVEDFGKYGGLAQQYIFYAQIH